MSFVDQSPDEITKPWEEFRETVFRDGALSRKTKEIIAMALAASHRCDPCFVLHLKGAHACGATLEEVNEALWVAVRMTGGPALGYAERMQKTIERIFADS